MARGYKIVRVERVENVGACWRVYSVVLDRQLCKYQGPRKEEYLHSRDKWEKWLNSCLQYGHEEFYQRKIQYQPYYPNPLKKIFWKDPRHVLSRIIHKRTQHGHFGSYFQRLRIPNRDCNCPCGELEDILHILVRCGQYENARQVVRQVSPELN